MKANKLLHIELEVIIKAICEWYLINNFNKGYVMKTVVKRYAHSILIGSIFSHSPEPKGSNHSFSYTVL